MKLDSMNVTSERRRAIRRMIQFLLLLLLEVCGSLGGLDRDEIGLDQDV